MLLLKKVHDVIASLVSFIIQLVVFCICKKTRNLLGSISSIIEMTWTLARLIRRGIRLVCCGLTIVSKASRLRRQKHKILRVINAKGFRLRDRDEHLRKDLLSRKLVESLLTPEQMEVVKVQLAARSRQLTNVQQKELERRLQKSERVKQLLDDVVEGRKERKIANLEILIMSFMSRRLMIQQRITRNLRENRGANDRRYPYL
ncbi:uncharacterized protein LOC123309154 [Coccinella septempunctata]|uniref:uncharacterized protein LOC123309154 n=1 Tax=Coccinella septempunctata TaxID=41139 RepID=UPI001D08E066|nr:uncharacterized protein LOC123309154 [Coccinella septempunctata]